MSARLPRSVGSNREQTFHEMLRAAAEEPEQALDLSTWREALPKLLATLPPMEAAILRFRFALDDGEELTLRAIGEKYTLSRERIRQLQALALGRLREQLGSEFRFEPENDGLIPTSDGSDENVAA